MGYGNENILQFYLCFIIIILKSSTFHFMSTINVMVVKICWHVTAFVSFFPANCKHIIPAFENGFE